MGVEAHGHDAVTAFVRLHDLKPETIPAVRAMIPEIKSDVDQYGTLPNVPTDQVRNDMYLVPSRCASWARWRSESLDRGCGIARGL